MPSVLSFTTYAASVLARCQNADVAYEGVCVMFTVETRTFKRLAFTSDNESRIDRMLADGLIMLVGVYRWPPVAASENTFAHWIEDDMRETARDFAESKRVRRPQART